MNRRQKIIVSVTGIFLVLLLLVGLTYAYFLTQINGNENSKSISVSTANLALVYGDGNGVLKPDETIVPGTTVSSKTFTVKNEGNAESDYAVILENFNVTYATTSGDEIAGAATSLSHPDDFKLIITCTSDVEGKACNALDDTLPTTNDILVTNKIAVGETQSYELSLEYEETGTDQSADMNKTLEGKINIIDTKSTIDIKGTVSSYSNGDYVQINSVPKISQLTSDGQYKVTGVEPGSHTIEVYSSDGTKKATQSLEIVKGEEAGVSGNVITMTEESRTATIDITETYEINIDSKIEEKNPFSKGTLAYEILKNAKTAANNNDSIKTIYREAPLTKPASQTTMLYTDGGAGTETSINFVLTNSVSTTYASNYYITYGDSYTYTTNYTIKNKDESALKAVLISTGYETLIGKYVVSYAGSRSSTPATGNDLSTIYYITNATSTSIEYIKLDNGLASNEKYLTYSDTYEFNANTGYYTLKNAKVIKYSEGYNSILPGKYIAQTNGLNTSNALKATDLSHIYLVTENSTKTIMTYKQVIAKKTLESYGSIENTITLTEDDLGTSYYYRGSVKDNYLEFNNMCWRIVRIEGDGSIKIILSAQKKCSEIEESDIDTAFIGKGHYGYNYDYVINSSGATSTSKKYVADYLNGQINTSTSMKSQFDAWLTSSGIDTSKLKKDTWCLGNTTDTYNSAGDLLTESINDLVYNSKSFRYDVVKRLTEKIANATLRCNGKNYETHESYIGTLTADEVAFAGGKVGTFNYTYYLRENASSNVWWTLSPSIFDGTQYYSYGAQKGYIAYKPVKYEEYSLRPAVTLKSGVQFAKGDGTINNPYTII